MTDIQEFVKRYTAVWNEPSADARRAAIAELWAPDGVELLESGEHRGHRELEARVAHAYEEFVRDGKFTFVPEPDAAGHHDTVTFRVRMIPSGGGDPAWRGAVVAHLDAAGQITRDYQFALS
ncbi:nuclear transport factor 2 family protein [Pseudonocardia acaciae]|uniref:nuclear transport factor 2 family protein n=1 Tax=Pseudonocardia acaciae TaxID=551276 RepID=UPI00048F81BA|nr:nuclear transport factor 2 family protein [Pseudonocardia acaciae]